MGKLSLVINTFNEEKNIARVIASAKGLVDEVVVVDMYSGDNTKKIAEKLGAKVYNHKQTNYVEPARNYAISKATGEWILILDADEELSPGLKDEVKKVIKKTKSDYFRLPRKNFIFGKWIKHSRWWPDYNIRLFKKGSVTWNEVIHSVPMTAGVGGDFPEEEGSAIVHHHYDDVSQYIDRLNRYTTIQAKERIKEGHSFLWSDIIKKPASEFFGRYFASQGYKDGLHGLALALLQSFSELVVFLKVWEGVKFKEQRVSVSEVGKCLDDFESELNYWKADSLFKENKSPLQIIKRKFRLP